MLKLYRVILQVPDIEKATKFYRQLLTDPGERVRSGRHYFSCDGTILVCFDPRELPCSQIDSEIKTQPWGERCFYAKDPFGNPLCFVDEQTVFTGTNPRKN